MCFFVVAFNFQFFFLSGVVLSYVFALGGLSEITTRFLFVGRFRLFSAGDAM